MLQLAGTARSLGQNEELDIPKPGLFEVEPHIARDSDVRGMFRVEGVF